MIARHLANHGHDVRVLLAGNVENLRGDALINFEILQHAGIPTSELSVHPGGAKAFCEGADWVVDALLGTGTTGTIREPFPAVIRAINAAAGRVLAIDLPSGLDCNTGKPIGECVRAAHTVTFVAPKLGFAAAEARPLVGEVRVVDIGVPVKLLRDMFGE